MSRKAVHVMPSGSDWALEREGGQRKSSIHDTQGEAIDAGRAAAQHESVELVIQGRNGAIRQKDSRDHDPFPPRDKH
jgi:hypothetical protein